MIAEWFVDTAPCYLNSRFCSVWEPNWTTAVMWLVF